MSEGAFSCLKSWRPRGEDASVAIELFPDDRPPLFEATALGTDGLQFKGIWEAASLPGAVGKTLLGKTAFWSTIYNGKIMNVVR